METITKEELFQDDNERAPNQQYKKALQTLVETRKNDYEKRMNHLDIQIKSANIKEELKKAKAIRAMKNAEIKNKCFKTMKNIKNPNNNSGSISHLLIQQGKEYKRIQDKDQMDELLWERNKNHFSQAKGTLCTVNPILELIGFGGTTEWVEKILEGEAEFPKTEDKSVIEILKECK